MKHNFSTKMHAVTAQKTVFSVSTIVPPRFISLILHPKPDSPYSYIECATSDVLISEYSPSVQ
jgi:hypothetical protein